MSLDTSTLYAVAAMIAALLGMMLLFFGLQEKIAALKWWGSAYLLGAASVALWTFGSARFGDMFALALNAVGFLTCGMVWNASRLFHGRKPNYPGLVLGALVWIATVMTLSPGAAALRLTIGAGIVAVYAALTANELWSERRRTLRKRWPSVAVPVLHGFVLMLPILLGDLLHPRDRAFDDSIWVTVFAIELVLYAVGTVFLIFMLVSERAVTVHKNAASVNPLTGMFNRRGFAEACSRAIEREAHARASGDGADLRYRPLQVDQRSFRPSRGRRDPQIVLGRGRQQLAHQRSVGARRWRRICSPPDMPAEEGVIVAERVREALRPPASSATKARSTPP